MSVASILAAKGREVHSIQPHRTLHEVSKVLAEKRIGAIVVTDASGRLLGILSERDIVRAIAQAGAEALNDAASRHMTQKVVTTSRDASILEAMEHMTAGHFRHMPVVEGERLLGVVSIGDLVKFRIAEIESEHRAMREYIASA